MDILQFPWGSLYCVTIYHKVIRERAHSNNDHASAVISPGAM